MVLEKTKEVLHGNPTLTGYVGKDTPIRLWIIGKGTSGQYFSLDFPTKLGYDGALKEFRHIAQLEAPRIATPVFATGYGGQTNHYPLNVGFEEIKTQMRQLLEAGIEDVKSALEKYRGLDLDKLRELEGVFQVGIELGNKRFAREEQFPSDAHFGFVSSETRLPPYMSDVVGKFLLEMPAQDLSSVFAKFEEELASV